MDSGATCTVLTLVVKDIVVKDIVVKDIVVKDIGPQGHWASRTLVVKEGPDTLLLRL